MEGCFGDDYGEGANIRNPWESFRKMWFSFPVPFKAGDILYHPGTPLKYGLEGPMVVIETTPAYYARTGRSGFDYTDMNVYGYFQNENGTIYRENSGNYMDFEYYPAERLTGKQRILSAVSDQLKGKIDLGRFCEVYLYLLAEGAAKQLMPLPFPGEEICLPGQEKGK